jgi:hypothetical protein
MYSIIGSGFGLYGYLPAIVSLHKKGLVLPEKYRKKILSRPELRKFEKDIVWAKNRREVLEKTTDLIIAVPPCIQYDLVKKIVKETRIKTLYLEKPIAPTPEMSNNLLKFLDLNKVTYVIGYSFLYLDLQSKFNILIGEKKDIDWTWNFMAHHFSMNLKNWKRYHDIGGGALRFYGIHIIALLSTLGYSNIISSTLVADHPNEPYIWKASISGKSLPVCHVMINCKSNQSKFNISNKSLGNIVTSKDPFDTVANKSNQLDQRVVVLARALNMEFYTQNNLKSVYSNINKLWGKVERSTKIIK